VGAISAIMQNMASSRERRVKVRTLPEASAACLLSEEQFRRMLCRERKRSERSRKQMLLMLIDQDQDRPEIELSALLIQAADALNSLIRETDLMGWFDANSVLGVIFTEFGESDANLAAKTIERKVSDLLEQTVTAKRLTAVRVSFYIFPDNWSENGRRVNSVLYPDLLEEQKKKKSSLAIKTGMDIAGSLSALMVLSPVFLVLAALVKLTSRGPVFFRQERVGHCGTRFILLKFRSMQVSTDDKIHKDYVRNFIAGKDQAASETRKKKKPFKITNDPRVTWIGKFMRRTSLDELPQFWNVLRGDMSLVGPRPPIPYELDSYDLWHRRRLLEAVPGITGLWQVQGRSKTTFNEMVRLDLQYSRSWSPILDVKILLQTPRAVFSGDGAY
jgi:lipopolysaccharide/colanic/teichoic acid biosynthesis glycosyltransferase